MNHLESEMSSIRERTIRDFGEQWTRFQDNSGYYGSTELLGDIVGPLLDPVELRDTTVLDIGSGTGRIVNMLIASGVRRVVAVEPSAAFQVLVKNVSEPARVTCLNIAGEDIPRGLECDVAMSIGVLHHVPIPAPVVAAAYAALRPGGKLLVWLYGKEGNGLYLALASPLRFLTRRLAHRWLERLVAITDVPLRGYIALCRRLPLPMHRYMTQYLDKLAPDKRRLVIYDQLKPAYAKYYTQSEARELLESAAFTNVRTHHRHGYSWLVIGIKPARD